MKHKKAKLFWVKIALLVLNLLGVIYTLVLLTPLYTARSWLIDKPIKWLTYKRVQYHGNELAELMRKEFGAVVNNMPSSLKEAVEKAKLNRARAENAHNN